MATINIDLDKILDVAQKGVRRASVFMGLGVNAALDSHFVDYQLTKTANIQLVPQSVPEETLIHFKEEFRIWIEANGFRELVETFAVYLDNVHLACLLLRSNKDKATNEERDKRQQAFKRRGISDKLIILRDKYNVSPSHPDYIRSLNKARNCLTHRRGIVGVEDLDAKQELKVEWTGMDIFAETPGGEKVMLLDLPPGGIKLEHGGTVKAQMVNRNRVLRNGELLKFSTRDTAEICWMFSLEAKATAFTLEQYSRNMGVTVIDKLSSKEVQVQELTVQRPTKNVALLRG